jgi:hypothetical protein
MYAGPLTIITTVLRSRSVEYMPLPLTLGTILCSSSWLGYGLVVEDVAIITPNAGGTVLGIMQIALYMCYVNTEESKVRAGGRGGWDLRACSSLLRFLPPHALTTTTALPPKLARSKVEELNMSFEQYRKSLQAGVVEDEKDRVPLI